MSGRRIFFVTRQPSKIHVRVENSDGDVDEGLEDVVYLYHAI